MNYFKTLALLVGITLSSSIFADSLVTNEINSQAYGYKYRGVTANQTSAKFLFQGTDIEQKLDVTGFDIDIFREVAVFVNEYNIGYLERTPNNDTSPTTFTIPASIQRDGENILAFVQQNPGWHWGISDLLLSVDTPIAAPTPISPVANTLLEQGSLVEFRWNVSALANRYRVTVIDTQNRDQAALNAYVSAENCGAETCAATIKLDVPIGRSYQWRVLAAIDEIRSDWSTTAIELIAPQDTPLVLDTNVSGGGFQGDVTITDDGKTVYSSADVAGIFKSSNGGLMFENINHGLESTKVATVAITPDNDQILYAGTGEKGVSGGLFRSVDGGQTWALTGDGAKARFAGNHSSSAHPVPRGHARSNGDLIVVDQGNNSATHTDDIVIAGSYKTGVRIFTRGGENEASAVNTSGFVRSVARNRAIPDIAYAAIQFDDSSKNGIYKIDYSNPSHPRSTREFSTLRPEGLTVLNNGHVYAAIGTEGIATYDGRRWKMKSSGLSTNNGKRQWTAVDGYVSGNRDIVYAGVTNLGGIANGDDYSTIWRTVDGGDNWSALVDASDNVSDTVYGKNYDWWFRIDAFREAGLGRKNSVVSSIDVARGSSANLTSDDIIYVSGRGGIWKSLNGGDSWQPAVYNMQATSQRGVAVNPNDPDQVVLANTDFVAVETRSGFTGNDLSRDKPRGSESRAYDAIFDAVSNEIILGVGDRDKNNPGYGEVFVKSASALGAPSGSGWTNTNLRAATASYDGRARAVSYGYHNGRAATTQTILAAVEGEGVYRYHNGNWSKSTGVSIGSTERSNFVWPDNTNSGIVYLLDLSSGLFRSNDGGRSWADIWPEMSFQNKNFYNSGYIAADDNNPTTLYLSVQGDRGSPLGTKFAVFRMDAADVGIFGKPGTAGITDITSRSDGTAISRPGPLAFDTTGRLWLTEQQDSGNSIDAGLYVMENPVFDTSFTDMTTDDYRNVAVSPIGIDISSDGHLYVAQDGGGLAKVLLPCRYSSGC